MSTQWNDDRPMAPHLQVWRWHPAMLSSILHRACSIISYIVLIKVAVGLASLALTGELPLAGLIFSPLGAIGMFVAVFALVFMLFAQLRHQFWDQGRMLQPKLNNTLSILMILAALILAAVSVFAVVGAGGPNV